MKFKYSLIILVLLSQIILPCCVWAYIGPGAGISAIGTVIAFVGAILLAIVGFVWYPVKRLLAKMKKKGDTEPEETRPS